MELNADGTHAGVMSLDQGTFTITAGNALGASSRAVNYYYDRVSLTFDGNLTVGTPIDGTYLSAQNTSAGGLKVTAGSDVVFAGRIYNYTRMWVNVGAGGTVTSSRPATLTLLCSQNGMSQDNDFGGENRADSAAFAGQVSVKKQGSYQHTLAATSSSTGTLKVTAGTLTLSGSWANCTNLVAAGGTFAVKNVNAFGDNLRAPGESPKVEVDVTSGASLVLDYTGCIDCAAFRVGGVKLYGTFGAPGSGADNEYAWISGTGLMRVLPKGTTIIFR